jgi:hypothetical protein
VLEAGSELLYYPRYALPVIVVLVVLSARTLWALLEFHLPARKIVLPTCVVVLVASPAMQSLEVNQLFAREDSRTLAKNWIEAHIPAGARIWIEAQKIKPANGTVQLQDERANLERRIEYWRDVEPKQARYLELQLEVQTGITYDLELARVGEFKSLAEYKKLGIQYFVVRPDYLADSRRANPGSIGLLQSLHSDPQLAKLWGIYPGRKDRPGPAVEVYEVQSAQSSQGGLAE